MPNFIKVAARAIHHAVAAGTIALCTCAWRRAQSQRGRLKTPRAQSLFLRQCLSEMAENTMIWRSQLPEWQQKRLSRLLQLYTADSVPNWGKTDENGNLPGCGRF
jgi:hypothetical protein